MSAERLSLSLVGRQAGRPRENPGGAGYSVVESESSSQPDVRVFGGRATGGCCLQLNDSVRVPFQLQRIVTHATDCHSCNGLSLLVTSTFFPRMALALPGRRRKVWSRDCCAPIRSLDFHAGAILLAQTAWLIAMKNTIFVQTNKDHKKLTRHKGSARFHNTGVAQPEREKVLEPSGTAFSHRACARRHVLT